MFRYLAPALRLMILFTVLGGIVYPLVVTGLSQWWFPRQANGSLMHVQGRAVGSALLGQTFTGSDYFHGRPSAAGQGYDGLASGGSNLGPSNPALAARLLTTAAQFRRDNPAFHGPIPADLLTASGSGLDPDISPAAAAAQSPRVAAARGLPLVQVLALVQRKIEPRTWHLLGEPRVNVLALNLALDQLTQEQGSGSDRGRRP